jgi:hypothetical protein
MGMDLTLARQLNRALLSIYYFGRKDLAPFAGAPPPPGLLPVDNAIGELASAGSQALGSVRLAMTDLARTRDRLEPSSRADQRVEGLIFRLATTYANLVRTRGTAPDLARQITDLSRRVPGTNGDTAYVRVLNRLVQVEPSRAPPEVARPRLVSYEVARRG